MTFHVSTQIGVVRHSERHLHSDPPTAQELEALRADVRATLPAVNQRISHAIAVAGTPTQSAAIDLQLDHYDPARIEGHILTSETLVDQLDRLSNLSLAERGRVTGIDPARAPVIVAGIAILLEVERYYGLKQIEASERDILWGLALSTAARWS